MDNGTITSGNLLRLIGIMAIGVGVAWALQTIGFGGDASAFSKTMWVLAAATISGAGAGLIVAANSLPAEQANVVHS